MTYHRGMGLLTSGLNLNLSTSGTASVDPNAWRVDFQAKASTAMRTISELSAAERNAAATAWAALQRALVDVGLGGRSLLKEELRFKLAFMSIPAAMSTWQTRGVKAARDALAALKATVAIAPAPVVAPTIQFFAPTTKTPQQTQTPYVPEQEEQKAEPPPPVPVYAAPLPVPQPALPTMPTISEADVATWRKEIAQMFAGIDTIGAPLRVAVEAIMGIGAMIGSGVGAEAGAFARDLMGFVNSLLRPDSSDRQVAGQAQSVVTSYQRLKPSLPAMATTMLDPILGPALLAKVPGDLMVWPEATPGQTPVPAQMLPQQPAAAGGGIPWLWIGGGAAVLVVGYMVFSSKKSVTPNKRRRRRR